MHFPEILLYVTILTARVCTALAAPHMANSHDDAEGSGTQVKSVIDEQLNKRQDKPSKIGFSTYSERDCKGYIGTADDITQSIGEPWKAEGGAVIYSFEIIYRGLQGQEQLDISAKDPITGDLCGDFIHSYFAGTSASCYNWGNINCLIFWINAGL